MHMADKYTKLSMESVLSSTNLEPVSLAKLSSSYHQALVGDSLHLLDGKLVYYEQTLTSSKFLCRIVVSASLRRDIFSTVHTLPPVGYMDEYIKFFIVSNYYFLGHISVVMLRIGLKNVHSAILLMSGVVQVVKVFSLGQLVLLLLSCM